MSVPRGEDTKVRRVVPNEPAWTGTLYQCVCTDVCANANTLLDIRSDCQVGQAEGFFGELTGVRLL